MYWWDDDPSEDIFVEITDREVVGENLYAPAQEAGASRHAAYLLVEIVEPGDLVVHYDTKSKSIIGASRVAGKPNPESILWEAHGTSARKAAVGPTLKLGLQALLSDFTPLPEPLTLEEIRIRQVKVMSVRQELIASLKAGTAHYFPWTPYGGPSGPIRPAQLYLAKLPRATLEHLPEVQAVLEQVLHGFTGRVQLSDEAMVESAVAVASGRSQKTGGQGFIRDQEVKLAIEDYAMHVATEFWEDLGDVEDVSRHQSFDLRCLPNGKEVHVEVKGTTTDGESVLLSPNEVDHARKCPHVALFVVSNIEVTRNEVGVLDVAGGGVFLLDPWDIDAGQLRSTGYVHTVPEGPNKYEED